MPRRTIYVLDEATGKVLDRIDVEGWPTLRIIQLERQLRAQSSDDVVVKDSMFDLD